MFLNPDSVVAEGIFKKWNTLYKKCKDQNIEIVILDKLTDYNSVDFIVFADFPGLSNPIVKNAFESSIPKILVIEEGPLIHKENWLSHNHELFKYIFTWNDDYVDNFKYFKFNVHHIDPFNPPKKKEKLCTLIARNKRAWGKNELYSLRRIVIRYFERKHSDEFDLFGEGWDKYYFPSNIPILRLFNGSKMYWFRSRLREKYPSWKGPINDKKIILSKYKFSFSFENSYGPTGYISEKIWDSFSAGTIPVYLGAPNITNHIPVDCFIDYRNFNNIDELYNYLSSMTNETYNEYLVNIEAFLKKQANGGQFSDDYFANNFIKLITRAI